MATSAVSSNFSSSLTHSGRNVQQFLDQLSVALIKVAPFDAIDKLLDLGRISGGNVIVVFHRRQSRRSYAKRKRTPRPELKYFLFHDCYCRDTINSASKLRQWQFWRTEICAAKIRKFSRISEKSWTSAKYLKNPRRRIVMVNDLLQIGYSTALPSSSISASSFELKNYTGTFA